MSVRTCRSLAAIVMTAVASLVVASCSGDSGSGSSTAADTATATSQPTTTTEPTSTTPEVPLVVDVPSILPTFLDTVYDARCGSYSASSKSDNHISVFDPKQGRFIDTPLPEAPGNEEEQKLTCAITRDGDSYKVVFLLESLLLARGLDAQRNIYRLMLYTPGASQASAQVTLDDVGYDQPFDDVQMVTTTSAIALTYRPKGQKEDKTFVHSAKDLAPLWSTSDALYSTNDDVIAFKVSDEEASLRNPKSGAEQARAPRGSHSAHAYFDTKGGVRTSDFKRFSVTETEHVSEYQVWGRYFVLRGSLLFAVYDIDTGRRMIHRSGEAVRSMGVDEYIVFGDRMYLAVESGSTKSRSIWDLMNDREIANSWRNIPTVALSGWTVVETPRGTTQMCAQTDRTRGVICEKVTLVRDVDGKFPGPWE